MNVQSQGDYVIATEQLTRIYGERTAVSNLDLKVRRGEVYGFLGPNGAGKTTTLRMLLGLIRPTSGSAMVAGARPGSAESLANTGAMIEQPGFYPHLSGKDNLAFFARYAKVDLSRMTDVLDQVDLADRAGDRFSAYSQGMKQRLGLAAALLKDPPLLLLDEPSNGLDPAGMADMRVLLRSLADEGRTVLISSHLLAEVEQICDRVGVIRNGQLVAEGTVDELRGSEALSITATPQSDALRLLNSCPAVTVIEQNGGSIHVHTARNRAAEINRGLVQSGIDVSELKWTRQSLEDVFLGLTSEGMAA